MLASFPIVLSRKGQNLSRPECILAEPDGTLWTADARGGVVRIAPEGTQTLIGDIGGTPNGIAFDRDGSLLIAEVNNGRLIRLDRDGASKVVLDRIEGRGLGAFNFVLVDDYGRLWLTISALSEPRRPAAFTPAHDGYLAVLDEQGVRIVADGLCWPNECRIDHKSGRLYLAETAMRRILVWDINGTRLGNLRVHGPDDLGGRPDGVTLDAESNLWVTDFDGRRLLVLAPDGAMIEIYRDPTGETLANPTSMTFAGPDLRTVHVGSLTPPHLPTFRSPVAGAPLAHWKPG